MNRHDVARLDPFLDDRALIRQRPGRQESDVDPRRIESQPRKLGLGEFGVAKVKDAKTVQGGSVKVNAMGGKVMIDGANVVTADIAASNGVIHVIDTVLMPK